MSNKRVITRAYLDEAGCSTPNCGHDHSIVYLHQRCHPLKGHYVKYDKATGMLTLECVVCDKPLVTIPVEKGE
jgi:hypothetical protein